MAKRNTVFWAALLFVSLAGSARAGQDPIAGYWEGALLRDGAVRVIRIEFVKDGSGYKGHIETPDLLAFTLQPVAVKYEAPKITFRLPLTGRATTPGRPTFAGDVKITLDDETGEMRGTVGEFSPPITIHLKRSVKPPEIAIRREEVKIANVDVTLAGALVMPATPGPHPAIIWIHGAVTNLRKENGLTKLLAQRGIASLVYDKRGSGESTGDLGKAAIGDLTSDALAAVRFLSKRPDIDPRQIGVHGDSAGAWVAYMVASRSETPIAFMITSSGPAENTSDWQFHWLRRFFRSLESDVTPEQLATVEEYLRLKIRLASKGEGREEHQAFLAKNEAFLRKVKGTRVGGFLAFAEQGLQNRSSWLRLYDCDPAPYLKTLRIPFLGFYGTQDTVVLPEVNAGKLQGYLTEAENKDFTIVKIRGVDHELTFASSVMGHTTSEKTRWEWERISPEYIDTMVDWLQKHVKVAR